MKRKYLIQTVSILCLALSAVFLSSCDDDDEKGSGQVELLSFGPTGVQHGDEITFIGKNLSKVTAIAFQPSVEVPSSAFTSVSNDMIKLTVPDAVESGRVVLKTPDGDIESKTIFDLEVPVQISSVTPEAKPGTNITISGDKLNWINTITFSSDLVVERTSFVSQSLNELVVTVPMEARTGFLTFSSGGTDPLTFNSEEPLIVTLPVVTTLTPASVRHTENLTLTGSDLDLVTQVALPGNAVVLSDDFISQSETEIVLSVPVTTTSGKLVLTAPSGLEVETEDEITIILPNVTAFSPSALEEHNPGVTLTLTGSDLDLIQTLTFPHVSEPVTSFESHTATELVVVIPEGAKGGTVVITTIHGFSVPISVPFGDQLTLAVVLYDDAARNGFGQWGGWGSTTVWNSTEEIRLGSHAIKVTYAGDNWTGGAQLGGGNVSTAGASMFAFSVFGGPGTEGKNLQLLVKSSGGEATKQVTIKEGAWTDFQILLSEIDSPANITELFFQNANFTGSVYIDHIGLK